MVKFLDEGPESEVQIFTIKTQIGHERSATDALSGRIKRATSPTGVVAILAPAKMRGYIFVEAENPELLKETIRGLPHVRGMLMVIEWKNGKSQPTFGTIPFRDVEPYLTPKPIVHGIAEGNIVELIAGPFKGEKARVQRIDESKEEVTVELFEAMVPIPITVQGDHVRVIEREIE